MDEYDLCVQDCAWWTIPIDNYEWGGYGNGWRHPSKFPNNVDPNGFDSMRVKAMSGTTPLDNAFYGGSFPYLTSDQLDTDIYNFGLPRFPPDFLPNPGADVLPLEDLPRLTAAVNIHLAM